MSNLKDRTFRIVVGIVQNKPRCYKCGGRVIFGICIRCGAGN